MVMSGVQPIAGQGTFQPFNLRFIFDWVVFWSHFLPDLFKLSTLALFWVLLSVVSLREKQQKFHWSNFVNLFWRHMISFLSSLAVWFITLISTADFFSFSFDIHKEDDNVNLGFTASELILVVGWFNFIFLFLPCYTHFISLPFSLDAYPIQSFCLLPFIRCGDGIICRSFLFYSYSWCRALNFSLFCIMPWFNFLSLFSFSLKKSVLYENRLLDPPPHCSPLFNIFFSPMICTKWRVE